MQSRADIQNAIDRYVLSIVTNAPELAPLAGDCVYGGPMVPEPLRGAERIRTYLGEISPFITRIRPKRTVIDGSDAAIVAELETISSKVLQGAWFFQFDDGHIASVQVFFDSRLLMRDMS